MFLAACDASAPALPDGGGELDAAPPDPDAGDDAGGEGAALERLDWRATRGAPIATTAVDVPLAELFALPEDGFVMRSECVDLQGCTYAWHDAAGTSGTRRKGMAPVTSGVVSPDGRDAALVALDGEMAGCDNGNGTEFLVATGTLQLLDLADGAPRFELALRSNVWSAPTFTPDGAWFFTAPIPGDACVTATAYRSVEAPFAAPPGLEGGLELLQIIEPRRWLAWRNFDIGLVDPTTAGTFTRLGENPNRFEVAGGWAHASFGFADLTQEVISVPPTGPTRTTMLRDEDWFLLGTRGRWIRVCSHLHTEGYRDCRVVDALGEAEPSNFRATFAPEHHDDAVLLDGAIVFVGPVDDGPGDGERAVQRIDLVTGEREILHPGMGELRPLGDGAAALLVQDRVAWLVEADREELVAEDVSDVLTTPKVPFRALGRQDDVAILVQSPDDGAVTLAILDVRTRRLATVTDALYFNPRGAPFAVEDCGQPWATRRGGAFFEGLGQTPQELYFVEEGEPATLWLLPIDLSAPPRRLGEIADLAACHPPMTSADGTIAGFAEDDLEAETTRVTRSSAR